MLDILSGPRLIDVHSAVYVQRSDACGVLSVEASRVCSDDLFGRLLEVSSLVFPPSNEAAGNSADC